MKIRSRRQLISGKLTSDIALLDLLSRRIRFITVTTFICVGLFITYNVNTIRDGEKLVRALRDPVDSSGLVLVPEEESLLNSRRRKVVGTKEDKVCVVHVGPHKTGSSTLQTFFLSHHRDDLEKENYKVPTFPRAEEGKESFTKKDSPKAHAIFAACLRPNDNDICSSAAIRNANRKYFQTFVNETTRNSSNILLSAEAFTFPDFDAEELASYLVPEYKIHIVLYYRRFYDWLNSVYNEQAKKDKRSKNRRKPDATFVQWLTNHTLETHLSHYSVAMYNRYKDVPGVFNVSVVNMHEDPDNFNTNARFACGHMDNAPQLCKLAKSQSVQQSNPSQNLDWKLLRNSIEFYHSIQLSASDERWKLIETKFNEMTDIPKVCLSPEWKNALLQISLQSEIFLTPKSWHNGKEGLENLKSDFEKKAKSKLCSLDIEKILTSPDWQGFLTDLDEKRTQRV